MHSTLLRSVRGGGGLAVIMIYLLLLLLLPLQVQSLQDMQESQLSSHQEQADLHRQQLQQLTLQEKVRQEELSRCR